MKSKNINVTLPVTSILGVLFVALKLTGYIAWSWWWVTAPFWLPLAIVLVILCSLLALVCIDAFLL